MGLSRLALKGMLLIGVVLVHLVVTTSSSAVFGNLLLVLLDLLLVHLAQSVKRKLDVIDKGIASAARKVLANNNTHHLQTLGVRSHGVGGDDPSTLAKLVGNGELVKVVARFFVQAKSDERETVATGLGHEDEAHLLDRLG